MLYNPNWKYSLEALIAWLETQDPNEVFSFAEPRSCLLTRWLESTGANVSADLGGACRYIVDGCEINLDAFEDIANTGNYCETFGNALKHAKEMRMAMT